MEMEILQTLNDEINRVSSEINSCLESLEIGSKLMIETTKNLIEKEDELQECEFKIRMETDFKSVGCNNKEERELYITHVPEYKKLYLEKRDLENDLAEYKHRVNVDERNLKFYNRLYDRLSNLEKGYYKEL